jgi:hypothetical protein
VYGFDRRYVGEETLDATAGLPRACLGQARGRNLLAVSSFHRMSVC